MEEMNMLEKFKTWFVAFYARSWTTLCSHVLKNIKLNPTEKEYVGSDGPKIISLHYNYEVRRQYGGCPEGRAIRREAIGLEQSSEEKLSQAGVSKVRQKFLETLIMGVNEDFRKTFPPKELSHLRYHFSQLHRKSIPSLIMWELTKIFGH